VAARVVALGAETSCGAGAGGSADLQAASAISAARAIDEIDEIDEIDGIDEIDEIETTARLVTEGLSNASGSAGTRGEYAIAQTSRRSGSTSRRASGAAARSC
jgi:hypothetical protein